MQSRRLHRLSRFRRNKRRLRDRLRQRIFFREDRMKPEAMAKPRVVVLTGAGISAESGIKTFRAADGLWEEHRVEDVATPEGFARDPALVQAFYNAVVVSCRVRKSSRTRRIWRWRVWRICWATIFCWSPRILIICTSAPATAG